MRFPTFIEKMSSHLISRNYWLFVCEIVNCLPRKLINLNYYTLMVVNKVKPADKVNGNYIFSLANESDLEDVSALTGIPIISLQNRLSSGDMCYIARDTSHSNKLVHTRWVHRGHCYIKGLGYKLVIDNNSAYIYWGYTHSDARSNGLSTASLYQISEDLKQNNVTKIYGFIDNCNIKSYIHHVNCNFIVVSKIWLLKAPLIKCLVDLNLDNNKFTIKFPVITPNNCPII